MSLVPAFLVRASSVAMAAAPALLASLAMCVAPGALGADKGEQTSQEIVSGPRREPIAATIGAIQTQRVIWHGRNSSGPAATTILEQPQPVCTPVTYSVANGFDAITGGSSMILQAGLVQGEGFASSYSFPAAAFPIEVTLVECFFASVAPIATQTGWRLDVYDGTPANGSVVFTVLSDPDPFSSGFPGDVIINPASATCDTTASAIKLQFSVDQTSDPADKMVVNNNSGTGIITVVIRIVRANNPGATACTTLDQCSNAFFGFEGQGNTLNFPNDDWLYAVSCSGGAPAGYTKFANLSTLFRPTTDPLHQITIVPTNCAAIPTGACCLNTGACVIVTPQSCTSQSGTYKGDNSVCATANCPQPAGACCLPFGGCEPRTQASCLNVSGVFKGVNTTCAGVTCADPIGACCASTLCASPVALGTCGQLGGTFEGNGTTCNGAGGTCPLGACCLVDGSCVLNESGPQCAMQNGTFKGVGSTCVNANCPQPNGACCTSLGGCVEVTQQTCLTFPGNTWKGAFTICTPSPCTNPGVCCRAVTCSTTIAQAQCTGANTAWVSIAPAACNVAGNYKTPCCRADYNKNGTVTPQDLFTYLAAYFAHDPLADFTGNGAGAPTIQSLFDYLKAYFQGQCT